MIDSTGECSEHSPARNHRNHLTMATTRNCSTPSTRTFPQARALLASAAHTTFTQAELVNRLRAAGVTGSLPQTRWALAMRYAWVLLPGGSGKGGR